MKHLSSLQALSFLGLLPLLAGAFLVAACGDDFPCKPNHVQRDGVCIPDPAVASGGKSGSGGAAASGGESSDDSGAGGTSSGGTDSGAGGDDPDAAPPAPEGGAPPADAAVRRDAGGSAFGDECSTGGGECSGNAPFCAVSPFPAGNTVGFCTVEGCVATPALCPPTWKCLTFTPTGFCSTP